VTLTSDFGQLLTQSGLLPGRWVDIDLHQRKGPLPHLG
jgi:hypothetical protein